MQVVQVLNIQEKTTIYILNSELISDMTRYIQAIPKAHDLLPALQKIGYKHVDAVADLIDNSIYAQASKINVKFEWNDGKDPEIIIIDNGCGLSYDDLIQAMNISSDQTAERSDTDLGRFGMGLKTASLSLGNRMTVITKRDGILSDARWDIDSLRQVENNGSVEHGWVISVENEDEKTQYWRKNLDTLSSGTVLLIDNLDLDISSQYIDTAMKKFNKLKQDVVHHLSITFHRFIEDKENGVEIQVDGDAVPSWNPIYPGSEELEPEDTTFDGYKYVIKKYVLPSPLHLTEEEERDAAGKRGWRQNQGIYVYRNRRLIVGGSWLTYVKKDSAYNLARIVVDIPAKHDQLWKIDIKKSQVFVPDFMDNKFRRAVRECTWTAAKRWNSRGPYSKRKSNQKYIGAVWAQKAYPANGYCIDRSNPLLREIMNEVTESTQKKLRSYLTLVENCYPSLQAALLDARVAESEPTPISDDELQSVLSDVRELISTLKKSKIPEEEIMRLLKELANFRQYMKEIEEMILEEKLL